MQNWLRACALVLVVAALGLPINDLWRYALLIVAAIGIFTGVATTRPARWLACIAIVVLNAAAQYLAPAPRIDEGHNVFIVDGPGSALERELPADAFRQMLAEFDRRYPADRRCGKETFGCWRNGGFPDRAYAFSADAINQDAPMSRRVTAIDFANPVWLRIGALNEKKYNWTGISEIRRDTRNRWNLLNRWNVAAPFFVLYRFPAAFAGGKLCFKGHVLWEDEQQNFQFLRNASPGCRTIQQQDAGRSIVGLSIAAPLAMTLHAPVFVALHGFLLSALSLVTAGAVAMLLIQWRPWRLAWPAVCAAIALITAFLNDSSFIGGVRPLDGGDDGLFYEGTARIILQHFLAGDIRLALMGDEKVFFYGGPGLRYLRAAEHLLFGDTFLGYLALMLAMPLVAYAALRRFLGTAAAASILLVFFLLPLGALFGSSLLVYVKWAARGFADPAAAFAFIAGLTVLLGRGAAGPDARFAPAFGAGLLFAVALFIRPNLAPAAGILLAGAGLATLWLRQPARLAGLCLGFLPVLGMALHNWAYGGVFVLFSSNAAIAEVFGMPPSSWLAAMGELATLDLSGENVRRGLSQLAFCLSGPSGSFAVIPIHVAALAVVVRVALWRRADPWLRLVGVATLAQHSVALFYLHFERYHFVTWFMTLVVCAVWMRDEGLPLFRAHFPELADKIGAAALAQKAGKFLDRWSLLARAAEDTGAARPAA